MSSPNNCFLAAKKQIDEKNINNILHNLGAY